MCIRDSFRTLDGWMAAVPVAAEGNHIVAGNPVGLFDASGYVNDFFGASDASPAAPGFAMLVPEDEDGGVQNRSKVNFVLNWDRELARTASPGGD